MQGDITAFFGSSPYWDNDEDDDYYELPRFYVCGDCPSGFIQMGGGSNTPCNCEPIWGYISITDRKIGGVLRESGGRNHSGESDSGEDGCGDDSDVPQKENDPKEPDPDCLGIKDPKTGKITPIDDMGGDPVLFPPNVDIEENIGIADENMPWYRGPIANGHWFESIVDYGQPWDYKSLTPDERYEPFGNFHYSL